MSERCMPSDLWPWVRVFDAMAGSWDQNVGYGRLLCCSMFQLHILLLPILLHGGMGANMYGAQSCGAILFLKQSCSILQHVFLFCFDLRQSIPAEEFASQSDT